MPRQALTESLAVIKEEFTSVWTLLNDTSRYLKRAGLFHEYEYLLRKWRAALNKRYKNADEYRKIKKLLIDLRKQLRREGHDLRLGSMDIEMKGFKSDNALKYGYRRAVLYLSEKEIYFLTGEENHSDLSRYFERRMSASRQLDYSRLHSIWFRWRHGVVLEIAGSDSETRDQYDQMLEFIENNKMFVLNKCRKMH